MTGTKAGRWSAAWALALALLSLSSVCPAVARAQAAESTAEAKALYADAANFQNNGAFDLAIEEWEKFLKQFSKDPLAAKAEHYLGVCHLQLKQYDKAVAAFDSVQKNHPKFELLEDTLLNLGWCRYTLAGKGDAAQYPLAIEAFEALLKQFPMGKFVDQALYFVGESYYQQGKKAEAVAAYDRLVKEQEKSSLRCDALYALGVAQEELGKYAEAGVAYDLFLAECAKSELVAEVQMRKAETVLQAGDYATAEKMLAEVAAVEDFPLADHAQYRRAFALTRLDKFAEAGALYANIATNFPDSERVSAADASLAAGRCFYRAEQHDDAATWFAKVLATGGGNAPEAGHWLSRIHLRAGEPAKAAELAEKLIPAAGESEYLVPLKMDQADALYELPDRRAQAAALYASIASEHPGDSLAPQALYNAAYASLELKRFDEGQKLAADFLKAYPSDKLAADVKYVAAECLLQQNKVDQAQAAYRELVENHADHAEIEVWRNRLALSLFLQKKYADVVALLSPVAAELQSPPQQAEAWYLVGVSQFHADNFAEAESALAAALAAAPQWRQADETLLVLSRAQRRLDKTPQAIATVLKLVEEFPESKLLDQANYRLGEYRYASDEFKLAAEQYANVVNKWPESTFVPYALYGMGWSHLKLKEFEPATAAFTALLEKHPDHMLVAETLLARTMSRRQQGDHEGAIDDAVAFLKSNPPADQQADALYEKGLAEVALKKNDVAAETLEAVLAAKPDYAGADKVLYELGWAMKSQNKNGESLVYFAKLANEHAESPLAAEALFHVGEDQYEKKQYDEAVKTYELARSKAVGGELSEKTTYKLGWAHFQLKKYDEAHKAFSEQIARHSQGPLVNDARFMQAESLFRAGDYEKAWPAYQEAVKHPAASPAMQVLALLHGGQTASQLKQWDDALELFAQIGEQFPDTPYLPEATYESGWAHQNLGNADEASKAYAAAAEKSRTEVGARARFMLGELLFEQKNHADAIKEFQRAMYGYGGDAAPAETKNWQAKSGFEAGRCAEVQIAAAKDAAAKAKLIADAKKFYGFVVEKHPSHELTAEAKKRLEALAQL
jgi:cellulose synthase operon protein C